MNQKYSFRSCDRLLSLGFHLTLALNFVEINPLSVMQELLLRTLGAGKLFPQISITLTSEKTSLGVPFPSPKQYLLLKFIRLLKQNWKCFDHFDTLLCASISAAIGILTKILVTEFLLQISATYQYTTSSNPLLCLQRIPQSQ